MFCHKLMWHQTAMTIKGCLILIWSCLEGFCEPTALHKLTQLPVFYGKTINVFFSSPCFSRLMSKGKKGGFVRWGWNVCWWSNTMLLSTHNQQRKEQRERPQWLPNEQQDSSNVLMFPYDQNMDLLAFLLFFFFLAFSWLIIEIIGRFCHRNN